MTTTGIDPRIQADVLRLARNGMPLGQIGNETGLMDKEVRLIIDTEKRRLAQNPNTAPARAQLPSTRPPAARPAPRTPPPVVEPRPETSARVPENSAATIDVLIDQAEASDIPKVRTAARRAVAALDNLRSVMDATETDRREKAAAKAKAEKEKADQAEKERTARVFRDELARQLEKADADLAELTRTRPSRKGIKLNISPEDSERRRQQIQRVTAERMARKAAGE